jgi:hypothetical protein
MRLIITSRSSVFTINPPPMPNTPIFLAIFYLNLMADYFTAPIPTIKIYIYTDSESNIKWINQTRHRRRQEFPIESLSSSWDLHQAIYRELINLPNIAICHIKAHQDLSTPNAELSQEAKLHQRIFLYRNHPIQPIGLPWIQWLLRMSLVPTSSLVRLRATRLVPALLKLRRLPAPVSALAGCLLIESMMMVLHHDRVLKVCARNRVFNDNYGRLLDVQWSPTHSSLIHRILLRQWLTPHRDQTMVLPSSLHRMRSFLPRRVTDPRFITNRHPIQICSLRCLYLLRSCQLRN